MSRRDNFSTYRFLESDSEEEESEVEEEDDDSWFQEYQSQRQREQDMKHRSYESTPAQQSSTSGT